MTLKTNEILNKFKNNELTLEQAQKLLDQPLDYATIDYDRKKRIGNHEVIYGAGKTKEQIIGIVQNMLDHDIHSILITRVNDEKSQAILKEFPQIIYDELSHICYIDEEKKEIVKTVKKNSVKKPKKKDNSLVQVISPYYGNFEEKEETDSEAVLTAVEDSKDFQDETNTDAEKTIEPEIVEEEKLPTVEDNLRNIAKIVEEEQDQLKIIEERTGEFKLDFGQKKSEEQNSLIDEIDDNMSLDELMSLYEKKFKD